MKCIRDGLEDYEYLWLLERALGRARSAGRGVNPDWIRRAEAALAVDPRLVRSLNDYTTDGSRVLAARREVAGLLAENPFFDQE